MTSKILKVEKAGNMQGYLQLPSFNRNPAELNDPITGKTHRAEEGAMALFPFLVDRPAVAKAVQDGTIKKQEGQRAFSELDYDWAHITIDLDGFPEDKRKIAHDIIIHSLRNPRSETGGVLVYSGKSTINLTRGQHCVIDMGIHDNTGIPHMQVLMSRDIVDPQVNAPAEYIYGAKLKDLAYLNFLTKHVNANLTKAGLKPIDSIQPPGAATTQESKRQVAQDVQAAKEVLKAVEGEVATMPQPSIGDIEDTDAILAARAAQREKKAAELLAAYQAEAKELAVIQTVLAKSQDYKKQVAKVQELETERTGFFGKVKGFFEAAKVQFTETLDGVAEGIKGLVDKVFKLEADNKTLQENLEATESRAMGLHAEKIELEEKYQGLSKEFDGVEAERDELEQENKGLKVDKAQSAEAIEQLQADLAKMKEELAAEKAARIAAEKLAAGHKHNLDETLTKLNKNIEDGKALRLQLSSLHSELKQVELEAKAAGKLRDENQQLKADKAGLEATVKGQGKRLEHLEAKAKEATELREENTVLRAEKTEQADYIKDLETDNESLKKENETLKKRGPNPPKPR